MKREDLFQGILDVLREWPNLDQQIFAQAHYHGQSIETISRSLNLDIGKVRVILQCRNRELYAALRKFRSPEITAIRDPACPNSPPAA
jgi:DNA-directed RNA polymerase specialized sigma24 family protein